MSDRSKLIERLTIHAAHHGNMTETRDAAQALREDQEELELLRTGAVYEKCQELIATIAAHEATIKELRARIYDDCKDVPDPATQPQTSSAIEGDVSKIAGPQSLQGRQSV